MAGKLIADQIEHSTAGSLDTSYVVNGSAKAWLQLDGTGTISTLDSLNSSSISDLGVGRYQATLSNNMNNANYAVTASDQYQTSGHYTPTTSSYNIFINNAGPGAVDSIVSTALHGDLA